MKCKICNNFENINLQSFVNHLRIHKITPNEYYDKYIGKKKCIFCDKETKFINIFKGYKKFCGGGCVSKYKKNINDKLNISDKRFGKIYNHCDYKNNNIECPICHNFFKSADSIGVHFLWKHKEFYNGKESIVKSIYDVFIKKDKEDECILCKNKKIFKSFTKGYSGLYCSISCAREYEIQNNLLDNKKSTWKYKKYKLPSGKIVKVQGYEPYCLDFLFKNGVEENNIILSGKNRPIIKYIFNEKEHKYFPDIYLKNINLLLEVKSQYLYDLYKEINEIKKQEAIKQGYNFIFVIDNNFNELKEILINDYKK